MVAFKIGSATSIAFAFDTDFLQVWSVCTLPARATVCTFCIHVAIHFKRAVIICKPELTCVQIIASGIPFFARDLPSGV